MPSKKAPLAKRATLPRQCTFSNAFLKDWARCDKSGRNDMPRLKSVMLMLIANEGPLPAEYRDHALKGAWKDCRDCHVHGDFLLLYRIARSGSTETLIFERLGTHSELF